MIPFDAVFPLDSLKRGESATIFDISGEDSTVHRLAEMGICCGCRVLVKESGNLMRIAVEGRDVMLRCDQSVTILVSPNG